MTINSNMVGYIISSIIELLMCKSKTVWTVNFPRNRYPWIWWIFQWFVNISHKKKSKKWHLRYFVHYDECSHSERCCWEPPLEFWTARTGFFSIFLFIRYLFMRMKQLFNEWSKNSLESERTSFSFLLFRRKLFEKGFFEINIFV